MKKILFTLFALCLFCTETRASGFETIDGLKYLINTDDVTATLVANNYSGDIVVPEKVTVDEVDYPVVVFGDECFKDCKKLKSVIIPATVAGLGDYCFDGCSSLTSINIPSFVTSLGQGCFSRTALTSITIPAP